jgi:hypothetical protein
LRRNDLADPTPWVSVRDVSNVVGDLSRSVHHCRWSMM